MVIAVIAAIAAGATTVIARNINANLAEKIGLLQGTLVNYIVGLFFASIFLLISGEPSKYSPAMLKFVPPAAYMGGLVGVAVVILSNLTTLKISAFYLTLFVFVGQLFTGVIIDYFTLGSASPGKIIGGFLVLAGLIYNLFLDMRESRKKLRE